MNRWTPPAWLAIAACSLLVCLAEASFADVIVLKNGRQITAVNVKETDGKVIGETPAGTVTLPASMVDRIERGASGSSPAADLRMSRPQSSADEGAEASPVARGGSLDLEELQRIRREAAGGDTVAVSRAAAAES